MDDIKTCDVTHRMIKNLSISDDSTMAEKEPATKEASADVQSPLSRTWVDLHDFVKGFK